MPEEPPEDGDDEDERGCCCCCCVGGPVIKEGELVGTEVDISLEGVIGGTFEAKEE